MRKLPQHRPLAANDRNLGLVDLPEIHHVAAHPLTSSELTRSTPVHWFQPRGGRLCGTNQGLHESELFGIHLEAEGLWGEAVRRACSAGHRKTHDEGTRVGSPPETRHRSVGLGRRCCASLACVRALDRTARAAGSLRPRAHDAAQAQAGSPRRDRRGERDRPRVSATRSPPAASRSLRRTSRRAPCGERSRRWRATGARSEAVSTDVGEGGQLDALAAATLERFGPRSASCVQPTPRQRAAAGTCGRWSPTTGSGSSGSVLLGVSPRGFARSCLALIAQDHGHIVNTASTGGLLPLPGLAPAHNASKHAIVALTECLVRAELDQQRSARGSVSPSSARRGSRRAWGRRNATSRQR